MAPTTATPVMRLTLLLVLTGLMGIPIACSNRSPTSPEMGSSTASSESSEARAAIVLPHSDKFAQPGVWGSEGASLAISRRSATLEILSSTLLTGGCFGAYGEIDQPIPNGPFSIAGTHTQLTGVFPGRIRYAAQYSGFVEGNRMSITVTVPALQHVFGPFLLTYGVKNAWSPCLYP